MREINYYKYYHETLSVDFYFAISIFYNSLFQIHSTQVIPFLLLKSLDENSNKSLIKRLYAIREALNVLDFDDESG